MSAREDFGWRDRSIALACLGAGALSRFAFSPTDATGPQSVEMQILVALVLRESPAADPPGRTSVNWLSLALRVDRTDVEEIVGRLERAYLVRRRADARDEIHDALGQIYTEDDVSAELPIEVTPLGFETVQLWLSRARTYFGGWPPERPGVDDAVG